MTEIVLATRNKNKVHELYTLIEPLFNGFISVLSLDDIGFSDEIEESGETFEENAVIKAKAAASLGYIGIADDSGLEADALGGAPGVFSARYAKIGASDIENNMKLLSELSLLKQEDRGAQFVSVIACVFPENNKYNIHPEPIIVRGVCRGIILDSGRGEGGFGYDPLFLYPPLNKTFAEMSADEKNSVSHRGKAMREFITLFTKTITEITRV